MADMEVEGTQEERRRNKETGHDAIEPVERVTAGSATVQGGSEAQCNSVPEDKEKSSAKKKIHEETKCSESKMIRIKGEWKYENNLSEEEKREIDLKEKVQEEPRGMEDCRSGSRPVGQAK